FQPESLWIGEFMQERWERRPIDAIKTAGPDPAKDRLLALMESGEGELAPHSGGVKGLFELSAPMAYRGHSVGCVIVVFRDSEGQRMGALSFLTSLLALAAPLYLGLQRREHVEQEVRAWQASGRSRADLIGES